MCRLIGCLVHPPYFIIGIEKLTINKPWRRLILIMFPSSSDIIWFRITLWQCIKYVTYHRVGNACIGTTAERWLVWSKGYSFIGYNMLWGNMNGLPSRLDCSLVVLNLFYFLLPFQQMIEYLSPVLRLFDSKNAFQIICI